MGNFNKMSTAEISENNNFMQKMDATSIKDAQVLFLASTLIRLANNNNEAFVQVPKDKNPIVTQARNFIVETASNLCKFITKEDYEKINEITKIQINVKESGKLHTDLLAFYMMFLTFGEKITVNKDLDKRLDSCLKVKYLDYCDIIMDNHLLEDDRHEEESWLLAVELTEMIKPK